LEKRWKEKEGLKSHINPSILNTNSNQGLNEERKRDPEMGRKRRQM
jgi:hypothetical protein